MNSHDPMKTDKFKLHHDRGYCVKPDKDCHFCVDELKDEFMSNEPNRDVALKQINNLVFDEGYSRFDAVELLLGEQRHKLSTRTEGE